MLWGIQCHLHISVLWVITKCLTLSVGCHLKYYTVLTTSNSLICSLSHSPTHWITLYCISVLHTNRHSHLKKSTEANLQHNRLMRHNNTNNSSVLPGVSLSVGSRHTLGSCGIIAWSECFLDWINGTGHWGQTCQGVGFVTGSHWVLSPCLCAVPPMWAPSYCMNRYKCIKSVSAGGQEGFQWFC